VRDATLAGSARPAAVASDPIVALRQTARRRTECGVCCQSRIDRVAELGAKPGASRAARRAGLDGRSRARRFGLAVLPRLADFVRPRVIATPAVDRVVERSSLARRLRADSRQPLTVRVPAVLLAVGAVLFDSGAILGRQGRSELMRFLLAHGLLTVLVPRCAKSTA
jgi:hypothetical protein